MAPQVDSINYNPVSIEAFESNGNDYCERQKKTVGKAFRVLGCLNNLGYVFAKRNNVLHTRVGLTESSFLL